MSYGALLVISLGHVARGKDEAAAAHSTFQANLYWSTTHFMLAATHAWRGRRLSRLMAVAIGRWRTRQDSNL